MYNDYNDAQLFQLAVTAKIAERLEYISSEALFPRFTAFFNRAITWIKEKLQSPTLVPVYCFEYAPDC